MSYTYEFPRPALTVDNVIFTFDERILKVLLINRKNDPFKGEWALPGGYVNIDESLEDAARRELMEETGIRNAFIEQFFTFGDVDRDPRGRVLSVGFFALVKIDEVDLKPDTDAGDVQWFPAYELPDLAFDHTLIIDRALDMLKLKVKMQPVGFELLPDKFSLSDLQRLVEAVLDEQLDKRNFRKKVLNMDVLSQSDTKVPNMATRAATLYKFDKHKFVDLQKKGGKFSLY